MEELQAQTVEMLDLTRRSIVQALGKKISGQLLEIPRPDLNWETASSPVEQKEHRVESLEDMAKIASFFRKWK